MTDQATVFYGASMGILGIWFGWALRGFHAKGARQQAAWDEYVEARRKHIAGAMEVKCPSCGKAVGGWCHACHCGEGTTPNEAYERSLNGIDAAVGEPWPPTIADSYGGISREGVKEPDFKVRQVGIMPESLKDRIREEHEQ